MVMSITCLLEELEQSISFFHLPTKALFRRAVVSKLLLTFSNLPKFTDKKLVSLSSSPKIDLIQKAPKVHLSQSTTFLSPPSNLPIFNYHSPKLFLQLDIYLLQFLIHLSPHRSQKESFHGPVPLIIFIANAFQEFIFVFQIVLIFIYRFRFFCLMLAKVQAHMLWDPQLFISH